MITMELCDRIHKELPKVLAGRDRLYLKDDNSYVSEGDLLIQSIVNDWINDRLHGYQLISEEMAPFNCDWNPLGKYVVLDPIDGTENFISGLKEWGVGVSIYANGQHQESCIYLPELAERQITGMPMKRYHSRIMGLSSSLTADELANLKLQPGLEYRIIGCAMYNLLMAARGSYLVFENIKGVNCWDILPGLNLALEAGCNVFVDGQAYYGQLLFPTKKYHVRIEQKRKPE
ncbi:inositol monophosphatase family protein [Hydrogenophilus thiooxidans]|uniref:inositol monophosphatase family protein n=1 Tax=Hydrogenophilus thiooxidans TaxID=2820326 RepID=UPI001C214674|nr:inositol monophosphatase family protein [Hydrogenophilus thiooxidans]